MADLTKTTINYVSPEKLSYYDTRLKAWVITKDEAVKADLQAKIDAVNTAVTNEETRAKAAELTNAQAAADAQAAAEAAQAHSEALAAKVGEIPVVEGEETPATIVDLINKKTAGIATDAALGELTNRVTQAEKDIDAIEADYLKAADKTELSEAITAEKERAEGIEAGLEERLAAVEGDYLKEADKTELEGKIKVNTDAIAVLNGDGDGSVKKTVDDAINKFATDVTNDEVVNSYKELIDWVAEHGPEAAEMAAAIEANEASIADLADLVGTLPEGETSADIVAFIQKLVKAEEDRATGVENGLDARLQAVEEKFTGEESVDGKIATAEQNAKDYADEKVNELATGAVADNTAAIEAINNAETGILAEAKKYADAEDAKVEERVLALETASATHALASDVTAVTGRVTTAEGKVTTLEGEMDAVEAAVATKAEAQALTDETTARTNADTALSDRLDILEAVEHVEISNETIDAMFDL